MTGTDSNAPIVAAVDVETWLKIARQQGWITRQTITTESGKTLTRYVTRWELDR